MAGHSGAGLRHSRDARAGRGSARRKRVLIQLSGSTGHPGQKGTAGGDHALLQPMQTDTGKADAAFPVGIDSAPFTSVADGIDLQSAY